VDLYHYQYRSATQKHCTCYCLTQNEKLNAERLI
jgi:hypothetical protein